MLNMSNDKGKPSSIYFKWTQFNRYFYRYFIFFNSRQLEMLQLMLKWYKTLELINYLERTKCKIYLFSFRWTLCAFLLGIINSDTQVNKKLYNMYLIGTFKIYSLCNILLSPAWTKPTLIVIPRPMVSGLQASKFRPRRGQ